MEKKVGIICATDDELCALEKVMETKKSRKYIFNECFIEGLIGIKKVVLVKCNVGKVNAARTTQILIDNFELEYVINVGIAGALNFNIDIGDIVIGKKLVQHDFDISAFGHSQGYIPEIGNEVLSDSALVKEFSNAIDSIEDKDFKAYVGTIATGDIFVNQIIQKDEIVSIFKADACEMEGAAIAQVCYLDQIPFIVLRSISDSPNGKNQMEYNEFKEVSCTRVANILKYILNPKRKNPNF